MDERTRVRQTLNYFLDVVDCNTGEKVGLMVDLSNKGLMVSSHRSIEVGQEYIFAVVDNREAQESSKQLPQKEPFTVKSVWCKQVSEDGFDVGFEFVEVPAGAKSVFELFTSKQTKSRDRKIKLNPAV